MNSVASMLLHPFSTLSLEEKLAVKNLGRPTPTLHITKVAKSNNKTYQRSFQPKYYIDYDWLCGCEIRNAVFCFPCLLFGGEKSWTNTRVNDLTHMLVKIKSHHASKQHINNVMALAVVGRQNIATQLSSAYRRNIQQQNEQVDKNRYILSKIIDCIRFCGAFELSLRGHDESSTSENPGIFLGLVDFVKELDVAMKAHLETATVFKGTSKTIQNELLDCMLAVCRENITDEINNAGYVAVMADETTDVSESMQMVLVYRYEMGGVAVERFWGFVNPDGQNADAISSCILEQLNYLLGNQTEKLIAQSYDGAAVMSGSKGGVNIKVKEKYKYAYFLHCYAHQLNLIMQRGASQNKSVKLFFSHLCSIGVFFARSPQRLSVLDECVAKRIPGVVQTRWNFQIRTVNVVFEHRLDLLKCFETMKNGEVACNTQTITLAYGLYNLLRDAEFLYWLTFFHRLLPHVEILYNQFQSRQTDSVKLKSALTKFEASIAKVRDNVDYIQSEVDAHIDVISKRRRLENEVNRDGDRLAVYAKEVCDVICVQTRDRFGFTGHLIAAKLLDPQNFKDYAVDFPENELNSTLHSYPMLQKQRLRTELQVLYEREDFHQVDGAISLLQLFINNNVQTTFAQTIELLKIIITTPMTTAEAERCFSALKRIKTFLRNTISQDRLNALAMLSVEKKMVAKIREFNTKVIEKFAQEKNRRMDFVYKVQ